MVVQTYITSDGKPRRSHYICSRRRANGNCENDLRLELNETNEVILAAIEKHALVPEAIERVILLSEESAQEDEGERLRRELKEIEKKVGRFLKAIEAGVDPMTVAPKLRELEARKASLAESLAGMKPIPPAGSLHRGKPAGRMAPPAQGLDDAGAAGAGPRTSRPDRVSPGKGQERLPFRGTDSVRTVVEGYASKAMTLREVPDWMIDAPADEPIDPARLPDAGYGQLLDRAVQRREKNRTRVASHGDPVAFIRSAARPKRRKSRG